MVDILGLKPEDYWTRERALEYDSKRNIEKFQVEITLKALEILGLKNGLVLDAGCGTGFSTKTIQDAGLDVIGIDVSSEMCALALKKGLAVVQGSFQELPFTNEYFDGIISVSSLQWVSGNYETVLEAYHAVSSEFFRVLKNGCKAVVQFYPSTFKEFELVKKIFSKKFIVKEVSAWSGRKAKVFLELVKK